MPLVSKSHKKVTYFFKSTCNIFLSVLRYWLMAMFSKNIQNKRNWMAFLYGSDFISETCDLFVLASTKTFPLYTRKEKGSHREVCTNLLRSSLNKATAQLGLSYSSLGIVIRLWAVQRYRSFPAERRGLSILKNILSFFRALRTSYSVGTAEYFPRGKSTEAQSWPFTSIYWVVNPLTPEFFF